MTGWLTALVDRPLAEQLRHAALAASAAVLIAATVLLALTRPATHPASARAAREASTLTTRDPSPPVLQASPGGPPPPDAAVVSRTFLVGYLAYAYGSAPASRISAAAGSLIASLQAHRPRVSPAMRASRPRVLELHATPASSGELGVSAVVNAGGLIDYTLGLTLARQGGRLLVAGVEQD
jgi:hypothetical protein